MNMSSKTAGLGLLLPAVLNPGTAALIGIGVIGFGIYRLLGDDEERDQTEALGEAQSKALPEPSLSVASTVEGQNSDGSDAARPVTLDQSRAMAPQHADSAPQDVDLLAEKQKLIREAMSELGKRSAAARARKKAEADKA